MNFAEGVVTVHHPPLLLAALLRAVVVRAELPTSLQAKHPSNLVNCGLAALECLSIKKSFKMYVIPQYHTISMSTSYDIFMISFLLCPNVLSTAESNSCPWLFNYYIRSLQSMLPHSYSCWNVSFLLPYSKPRKETIVLEAPIIHIGRNSTWLGIDWSTKLQQKQLQCKEFTQKKPSSKTKLPWTHLKKNLINWA